MRRLGLSAAAVAAVLVFSSHQEVGQAASNSSETYKDLNLFGEVLEVVRADYVGKVKDEQLVEFGDQRHADLARSALQLFEQQEFR